MKIMLQIPITCGIQSENEIDGVKNETVIYHPADWHESVDLTHTLGANLRIRFKELDYKESWAPKNWSFWTVVLEKTLESPLDCKEIQPVHPKGDQSWVFIGRTDVEAVTPILWLPDVKSWFIWKDPDAWKDWRQEEKGTTEDEMVGWHHQLNGHGFGWTPGVGDGQGGLACCSSWGHKKSDTAEQLNWTELKELEILSCSSGFSVNRVHDFGLVAAPDNLTWGWGLDELQKRFQAVKIYQLIQQEVVPKWLYPVG